MTPWTGVVLAGGASRRMGQDKALLAIDGRAMAQRAAAALTRAGAAEVFCVGGDAARLAALGLDVRVDDHPGEGPLGAVLTALRQAAHPCVMVLACDVVDPTAAAIGATIAALTRAPDADAAVPTDGTRPQPLHAAYRTRGLAALERAFAAGERSIARALGGLVVVQVANVAADALLDADTPTDLYGRIPE